MLTLRVVRVPVSLDVTVACSVLAQRRVEQTGLLFVCFVFLFPLLFFSPSRQTPIDMPHSSQNYIPYSPLNMQLGMHRLIKTIETIPYLKHNGEVCTKDL